MTFTGVREIAQTYLDRVPCDESLKSWLDAARVPRLKSNPSAARGGGHCYYLRTAVERMFQQRLLPGRLPVLSEPTTLKGGAVTN